jgi:hypothetical protein
MAVCGSKMESSFPWGRNLLPFERPPAALRNDLLEKLREMGKLFGE